VTPDGNPKLLDFGIAKVIRGENDSAETVGADAGEILLTPEYSSPEQVVGEPVTTASDVYSLTALLYHLLAGRSPHRLTGKSAPEITESICRVEPEKPSAAALRQGRRRTWSQELAGDLDTIVLMACARNRNAATSRPATCKATWRATSPDCRWRRAKTPSGIGPANS
jgi:serine/threonine protein kinase